MTGKRIRLAHIAALLCGACALIVGTGRAGEIPRGASRAARDDEARALWDGLERGAAIALRFLAYLRVGDTDRPLAEGDVYRPIERPATTQALRPDAYEKRRDEVRRNARLAMVPTEGKRFADVTEVYVEAARHFDEFEERFPDAESLYKGMALYWAGDSWLKAGRPKEAYARFTKCRDLYPEADPARPRTPRTAPVFEKVQDED